MTPTLYGRWQTRLLLLATVGGLVTVPFALGWVAPPGSTYAGALGYVALFGVCLWDPLYQWLQSWRWDRDWPAAFQLLAGVWEGIFLAIAAPWLPGLSGLAVGWFALHYGLVWLAVFLASQSAMRLLFPRWRFRGGQWF